MHTITLNFNIYSPDTAKSNDAIVLKSLFTSFSVSVLYIQRVLMYE